MNVFIKNRRVGLTEAYYRILKPLHLQESDVQTKYVHTGFPDSRTKFLRKLNLAHNDDAEEDVIPINLNPAYIVENKDSGEKYYCPPSLHEKYAARPEDLEDICLAQFVMYYHSVPKSWKKSNKEDSEDELVELVCPGSDSSEYLPKFITLQNNLGVMRRRSFPLVLRWHKFKETNQDLKMHQNR